MSDTQKLHIIVVGAGYAGLAAAIELVRKDFKVTVYEAVSKLTQQGDILQIASNATRVLAKWGNLLEEVKSTSASPASMRCQNQAGELLLEQDLPSEYGGFPNVYSNRGKTQKFMYEHAISLGVIFNFNCRVTSYVESSNGAGVIIDGKEHLADGVVGADGVHSRARALIVGKEESPKPSGFSVFRSWFPLEKLKGQPILEDIVNSEKDLFRVWIGPNTHAIVLTNVQLQYVVCFCTHKDTFTGEESWNNRGTTEDMLKAVDGWDEKLKAVIRSIPEGVIIDWKLLWRDPVKTWVTPNGRIAIVGDSAHPHLATSGQGAAQAIEDGATIAALLDRAGKDVPLAFRAFERLRFERTSLTQRMGWELRQVWHQTDWAAVKANPDLLKMPQPAWLFGGDSEKYAYDSYDAVAEHILKGTPFTSTNVPEGYVHEEWTIETMMKAEQAGEEALLAQVQA